MAAGLGGSYGKDTGSCPSRKVGSLDIGTGSLYDTGGTPIAGPAASNMKRQQRLAEEDKAWEEWHANYERGQ